MNEIAICVTTGTTEAFGIIVLFSLFREIALQTQSYKVEV